VVIFTAKSMRFADYGIFVIPMARKFSKAVGDVAGLKAVIEHKHRF
jgi:hypothetical protein